MVRHTTRETTAEALFDQIWTELASELDQSAMAAGLDRCTFRWLLPELVHLLDSVPDHSTEQLKLTVRLRVVDWLFIEDAGDLVLPPDHEGMIEQLVMVLTLTLERLRHEAGETERRSTRGTSMLMCG
ncbi:hypothetical protein ACERK3_18495 [Phycisphaerales bacterium AB-hyl4]|uniref:Uncharacterized protein n=1 Tax=Natronomicrosphaera hydrolytica TaxID=3242702 RepID=A0ABV4UBD7_9BACT